MLLWLQEEEENRDEMWRGRRKSRNLGEGREGVVVDVDVGVGVGVGVGVIFILSLGVRFEVSNEEKGGESCGQENQDQPQRTHFSDSRCICRCSSVSVFHQEFIFIFLISYQILKRSGCSFSGW